MRRTFLKTLLILGLVGSLLSCTRKSSEHNSHSLPPRLESSQPVKSSSSESELFERLETFFVDNKANGSSLKSFYEEEITDTFLQQLSIDRDPEKHRLLTRFHQLVALGLGSSSQDQDIQSVSLSYYYQIERLCGSNFSDCQLLVLYKSSVYAPRIFSLVESFIDDKSKEQHEILMSIISKDSKQLELVHKELHSFIDKMEEQISVETLTKVVNLVLLLSSQSEDISPFYVKKLIGYIKNKNLTSIQKKQLRKVLSEIFSTDRNHSQQNLADEYMKEVVEGSEYYKFILSENFKGLLSSSIVKQTYKQDWKLHFILLEMLESSVSDSWHKSVVKEYLKTDVNRKKILNLVEQFLQKKFLERVYESHRLLGREFSENFEKHQKKVDSLLVDYFGKSGGILSSVWSQFSGEFMSKLTGELSQYFLKSELQFIEKVSANLDKNIAVMVIFPALFNVGYHALEQGDFDFILTTGRGVQVHINGEIYFQDLFQGNLPSPLSFLKGMKLSSSEILVSFYFSLEEKVLKSYGLGFDISDVLLSRYLSKDIKKLSLRSKKIKHSLEEGGVASLLLGMCNKISESNFSFTYDRTFSSLRKEFFFGEPDNYQSTYSSIGTSYNMHKYNSLFNSDRIEKTLSEELEFVRSDLHSNLVRMQVLEKALEIQGELKKVESIKAIRRKAKEEVRKFSNFAINNFFDVNECTQRLSEVEKLMKLNFIEKELTYIRSTYKALAILNQYDSMPDITELRLKHSKSFDGAYLKRLPQNGDFVDELNKVWLSLTRPLSSQVINYQKQVINNLGFVREQSGRYIFLSSNYESLFRKISFMQNSSDSGSIYPILKVREIPISYKDLSQKKYHKKISQDSHVRLSIKHQSSEDQFASEAFSRLHKGRFLSGISRESLFKTAIMNMASVVRLKSFLYLRENYNYSGYQQQVLPVLEKDFRRVQDFSNQLVEYYNISSKEEQILTLFKEKSFLYESISKVANGIYVQDTKYVQRKVLGLYDVFLNSLVSYRLGRAPQFRKNLYVSHGGDLVNASWVSGQDSLDFSKVVGQQLLAEKLVSRHNIYKAAKASAPILEDWENTVLFNLDSQLKKIVLHALKVHIAVDEATANVFLDWVSKHQDEQRPSYYFDLGYPRLKEPPYFTIAESYKSSQREFHEETKGIFRKDYQFESK